MLVVLAPVLSLSFFSSFAQAAAIVEPSSTPPNSCGCGAAAAASTINANHSETMAGLLAGNSAWATRTSAADPVFFQEITQGQDPKVCS